MSETCWSCKERGFCCPTCGLCLTCHPAGYVVPETLDDVDPIRDIEFGTYLDYCSEVDQLPGETAEEADVAACDDCPLGGAGRMDCSGVWRWRDDNEIVTDADRERYAR